MNMSRKRRNTSSPEPDYSPPPKRARSVVSYDTEDEDFDDPQNVKEQPRLDPTSGLHNAFPGLGDDDDELFYGPATDGVEYLRMVRSEAKGVPSLLHSQANSSNERRSVNSGEEHAEGLIYFDGTYISNVTQPETNTKIPEWQQLHYNRLLERFYWLRDVFRRPPPLQTIQSLDATRPITLPPDSQSFIEVWEEHILAYDPLPAQIASIDSESVLEIVKVVTERLEDYLERPSISTSRVGSWIWALLANCPGRGELDGEDIAELRALAVKAVELVKIVRGIEVVGLDVDKFDKPDQEMELNDDARGTRCAPKAMVLDTIITIVGEVYGQRDLLEHRVTWNEGGKARTSATTLPRDYGR